jgi:tRNA (adenine22-N1)-methyltransferase
MMSSSRGGDCSSLRLKSLAGHYTNQEVVWDIGCDHGLLGLSFTQNRNVKQIHLVDPSPSVMEKLEKTVKDSYISIPVFLHLQKGQDIKTNSQSNCFFIAGMGGKEIGEIILHLCPKLSEKDRIVISPHRKVLELRRLLGQLPLESLKEEILCEEDQYYQVMVLKRGQSNVHPYGEFSIWNSKEGRAFLEKQIAAFSLHRDLASQGYVEYLRSLRSRFPS